VTTWISHLRIADALLDHIGGFEPEAFYYGNIAPDSGIPNKTWTKFKPPKTITHFMNEGDGEDRIRDLEFYSDYIASCASKLNNFDYSFRFGYFFHLVSDNLWAMRICSRTKADYAVRFAEDKDFIWQIKDDWYGLDHKYLRDNPENEFWEPFSKSRNPRSPLPFLPQRALHHQLDYIKDFYSNRAPDNLDRPYPYLSEAAMNMFVADTTRALTKIYDVLVTYPDLTTSTSALAWLEPEDKEVYAMPLGDALVTA
jgi:hypothetical protein